MTISIDKKTQKIIKLNLGCGDHTPDGWVNVDYALGAWIAKIPVFSAINAKFKFFNLKWSNEIFLHDLTKKFPWQDNSVDVIYSSHTLEHLSKTDGLFFLKECYRILRPDGIIRIVVPDLKVTMDMYSQGKIPADDIIDTLYVNYVFPDDTPLKKKLAPFIRFPHKCMYDIPALLRVMSQVGFTVMSKKPFESEIENVTNIEIADRTDGAVIVEGKKIIS